MKTERLFCGVDVSSETLDICYETMAGNKEHLQVSNNKKGFTLILKTCGIDTHFVMESTGVYHMGLMFYLHEKGCVFSVVNALQIKRYIQMHLERNKSDKKDARRICEYGIDWRPEPSQLPDKEYFECRAINNALHDLTKEITRLSNQIHALRRCEIDVKDVVKSYEGLVRKMKEEQRKLESLLQAKLKSWEPELLSKVSSVKGIGKKAAAELLIYTKLFKGMESYKQLISYAGLSPVEYSSGSSIRGKTRICKQGGKQIRNILYMCALNAKKTNRSCRELFDRLVAQGKNKKLAVIAVCNKLLKQVFGCVKNNTFYQDDYVKNIA
jgi:transposase